MRVSGVGDCEMCMCRGGLCGGLRGNAEGKRVVLCGVVLCDERGVKC